MWQSVLVIKAIAMANVSQHDKACRKSGFRVRVMAFVKNIHWLAY